MTLRTKQTDDVRNLLNDFHKEKHKEKEAESKALKHHRKAENIKKELRKHNYMLNADGFMTAGGRKELFMDAMLWNHAGFEIGCRTDIDTLLETKLDDNFNLDITETLPLYRHYRKCEPEDASVKIAIVKGELKTLTVQFEDCEDVFDQRHCFQSGFEYPEDQIVFYRGGGYDGCVWCPEVFMFENGVFHDVTKLGGAISVQTREHALATVNYSPDKLLGVFKKSDKRRMKDLSKMLPDALDKLFTHIAEEDIDGYSLICPKCKKAVIIHNNNGLYPIGPRGIGGISIVHDTWKCDQCIDN